MSTTDGGDKAVAVTGNSPAETMLRAEFESCRKALVSWQAGAAGMHDGQREFDRLWTGIIKNVMRLYGKDATREALGRMGRSEDVTRMY